MEIARRGYEAVLRGDFDAIRAVLHPDVKWHGGEPAIGCQNRRQTLSRMRRSKREGRPGELIDVIDAGDDQVVVVMQRMSDDGGPPERVANLTSFRDGMVIEMVHYASPEDALAAAGQKTGSSR